MIKVSISADADKKNFDYNTEVGLINQAAATFQDADVDWYIKVDDIMPSK